MIFITGDTHANIDIHKLNMENFPIQRDLTRDDYVIVCGDFGLVWDGGKSDKWWQRWLFDKPFTTLFVDGNHENHDLLDAYPVSEWNGGKVHYIQPNIIHLMRGQVYDIDGLKVFAMGGAASHDKEFRKEGISWWAREMPSAEEYEEAERNLEKAGWRVDCVITHDAPTSVQAYLGAGLYASDELNAFFERLLDRLEFQQWYFGHYHTDMAVPCPGLGVRGSGLGKVSLCDDLNSGCSRGAGENEHYGAAVRREFRAMYRDIVLIEHDRAMAFGMPLEEKGERIKDKVEVSANCNLKLELNDGLSVAEKVEKAFEVFDALEQYEAFRNKELEK